YRWYVTMSLYASRRTERTNSTSPLLPRTSPAQTSPIRSPARLPGRRPSRSTGGARFWLFPQFLPRPLSSFSPGNPTRLFSLPATRPPDSTPEVGGSRPDRPAPQAEPFGL